jgi:hypothetical protein
VAGSRFERVAAVPSRPGAAWWLAAAAAVLFAVALWDDARLRRQREDLRSQTAQLSAELKGSQAEVARRDLRVRVLESDDVRILFLGGKDPQPSARGKVFWSEKAKTGMILAGNLAPLPPDKQYELWVFAEGKAVAAGVFNADASGRALFSRGALGPPAAQNRGHDRAARRSPSHRPIVLVGHPPRLKPGPKRPVIPRSEATRDLPRRSFASLRMTSRR